MGLYLTSVVCQNSAGDLTENFTAILALLTNALNKVCSLAENANSEQTTSITNSMSYAVQAFNAVVPYLGSDQMVVDFVVLFRLTHIFDLFLFH